MSMKCYNTRCGGHSRSYACGCRELKVLTCRSYQGAPTVSRTVTITAPKKNVFNFTIPCANDKCSKMLDRKCSIWNKPSSTLCPKYENAMGYALSARTEAIWPLSSGQDAYATIRDALKQMNKRVDRGDNMKKPITLKEALDLSILIWDDLAESGAHNKSSSGHYGKVSYMKAQCPLCEHFREEDNTVGCKECPLKSCSNPSLYSSWCDASSNKSRKQAAKALSQKIKDYRAEKFPEGPSKTNPVLMNVWQSESPNRILQRWVFQINEDGSCYAMSDNGTEIRSKDRAIERIKEGRIISRDNCEPIKKFPDGPSRTNPVLMQVWDRVHKFQKWVYEINKDGSCMAMGESGERVGCSKEKAVQYIKKGFTTYWCHCEPIEEAPVLTKAVFESERLMELEVGKIELRRILNDREGLLSVAKRKVSGILFDIQNTKEEILSVNNHINDEKAKTVKKLFLTIEGNTLVIAYGREESYETIGAITQDGQAQILSDEDYLEIYNEWIKDGWINDSGRINREPVAWEGRSYSLSESALLYSTDGTNTNIKRNNDYQRIYDFKTALPACSCKDPNIITTDHNNRVVIF